jgi:hypothetical protein
MMLVRGARLKCPSLDEDVDVQGMVLKFNLILMNMKIYHCLTPESSALQIPISELSL